ncbi:GIN domain-containing protein, partial [Alistipes putredinis]
DARRFKNLEVTITTSPASYHTFIASGGSEIYSPEMQNLVKASFIISGGSHAKISATCDTASIECSGGSELTLTGASANANIICSGGSRCYAYDFATETATVDISGGSDLEITVTGSLTGDNSGGSHIRYKGTPSYMNINNTGGSTTAAAE